MDGAGDDWIGWMADGVAAGLLGAAVGTCLLLLGGSGGAVIAAAASGVAALMLLRQVKPEPRRFRLPAFDQPDIVVEQVPADILELCDAVGAEEALLLDDPLDDLPGDSRVVQLFAPRALPTPGELRARIEAHLQEDRRPGGADNVLDLEVDAAAALRQALGELRRSLA
ncbi:hypothetical protein GCM10022280_13130 [Sphingomonas swuensis]|uniref:Uncharacterized protein n=1 Tax=Sphingomonas swuensis TaxID=977800 RepID=A0ABP7SRZ0_9SPHN